MLRKTCWSDRNSPELVKILQTDKSIMIVAWGFLTTSRFYLTIAFQIDMHEPEKSCFLLQISGLWLRFYVTIVSSVKAKQNWSVHTRKHQHWISAMFSSDYSLLDKSIHLRQYQYRLTPTLYSYSFAIYDSFVKSSLERVFLQLFFVFLLMIRS